MRRVASTLFALTLAVGAVAANGQQNPESTVKAWSSTNGSFGEVWSLSIEGDSVLVTRSSELGAKTLERHSRLSAAQRQAILRAIEQADFFALPGSVGPAVVWVDGPANGLEVRLHGRVHKVFLNDPERASGAQVERFRRVWRIIVANSPVKPPLP
jgi:hypothetical protein